MRFFQKFLFIFEISEKVYKISKKTNKPALATSILFQISYSSENGCLYFTSFRRPNAAFDAKILIIYLSILWKIAFQKKLGQIALHEVVVTQKKTNGTLGSVSIPRWYFFRIGCSFVSICFF